MQVYAEIIRPLRDKAKIEAFCSAVEVLDLKDNDIEEFAWRCGFMISDKVERKV